MAESVRGSGECDVGRVGSIACTWKAKLQLAIFRCVHVTHQPQINTMLLRMRTYVIRVRVCFTTITKDDLYRIFGEVIMMITCVQCIR